MSNSYKKEVNVKIQGAGVGGCDITMQPGEQNPSKFLCESSLLCIVRRLTSSLRYPADCWCLWGTVNYSFCAYTKMTAEELAREKYAPTLPRNETNPDAVKQGRCPIITGESLLCSDLASLGNCYDGAYSCQVDTNGFCNCQTV